MNKPIKVMTIFGTRPEAVKMAPLVLEFQKHPEYFKPIVAVTAQHRQMLDQVLELFSIQPDYDLDIMKERQTLADITTRAMKGLDSVMKEAKPDIVLVHGDTTTTFVASLAAFYNQIVIGHVEAGLRTWNKYSPYPEEMNRQLTGTMADLHFAPTSKAEENLLNENKKDNIFVTGNTATDALKTTVRSTYSHPVLNGLGEDRLILLTAHRRENLGEPMRNIFRAVKRIIVEHDDVQVVYPVHLNPLVQELANEVLGDDPRVHLIEPLDVLDFHNFASRAFLILTDSGGIQEEAPSLGVPVLVLRDTTERPEGITAGTLRLAGTDEQTIYDLAHELLTDQEVHEKMSKASNPYGDGNASVRIAEAIRYYFKQVNMPPTRFEP
ncbi:UDP-N-acetylglucosamine 2-epimerase (non-hydrolyzing) [Peribacillus frigoritolerans]|uniref:non-hydrolyzing UDP-N-acetylglucosamine 2-epimerase n=1 Tax=Peribacillus frigoritolerans TaxID=450367 RepID=UPI002E1D16BB|nr:UDP-N-acetylglucosamine 2-epimerase (non-hydrolyzing) [Peribacillus frigoritolerans]